ncbi:MAG TPA: hypothetical protein VGK94_15305 [Candidatus Polarisedimenticolia bacterium]|jgi:hypothetical protein
MTIPRGRVWKGALLLAILLPFGGLYWRGAMSHSRLVNTDRDATDQSAYMNYARKMHDSGYSHVGDRNRMPVYPFLLSLMCRPGLTDEELFERAKVFNVGLSLAILAALWWIIRTVLSAPQAVPLLLVVAFTFFLFKAPYVQSEVLYYFLIFCTFVLMCRYLARPGWRPALAAGTVAALAHLTKASVLPGMILFLGAASAKTLFETVRRGRDRDFAGAASGWVNVGLVALSFCAVLYPYISTSKRVFGRYFYNVNSTFYIWYDTRDEIFKGTRAHGDREAWPRMPPEEIPGMAKYLREHTAGQILERGRQGLLITHRNLVKSFGFYRYLILYAGLALFVLAFNLRSAAAVARERPFLVLFALCWLLGYGLIYCWIAPINSGPRLPMQQVLPLAFTLACVAFHGKFDRPVLTLWRRRIEARSLANAGLLVALLAELHSILTTRILTLFAGA